MKIEQEFVGRTEHFADFLRKVAEQLTEGNLVIRGRKITLSDADLEYKISHKNEHGANKLSLSIEWLDDPSV